MDLVKLRNFTNRFSQVKKLLQIYSQVIAYALKRAWLVKYKYFTGSYKVLVLSMVFR